jgi:hypothetical protein
LTRWVAMGRKPQHVALHNTPESSEDSMLAAQSLMLLGARCALVVTTTVETSDSPRA